MISEILSLKNCRECFIIKASTTKSPGALAFPRGKKGKKMIYRTEHPKPQFQRDNWLNLNGEWQFEIDRGNSGEARKLYEDAVSLSGVINVPFCPQSKLSGIQDVDFMSSVWYKRTVTLTSARSTIRPPYT